MDIDSVNISNTKEYVDRDQDRHKKRHSMAEIIVLLFAFCLVLCLILCQVKHSMDLAGSDEAFNIEGVPLEFQAYIFEPCTLELSLVNKDNSRNLSVLVNGAEADMFNKENVELSLKAGDVVELDASGLIEAVTVKATNASENIKSLVGKKVTVFDGIVRFAVIEPITENQE